MKIIEPSYDILKIDEGEACIKHIELCARNCYKSEDKIAYGTAEEFLRRIVHGKQHYNITEFGSMTVRFIVSRAIADEIRTHRMASHLMESTRYCNYQRKGVTFVKPLWADVLWEQAVCIAGKQYEALIEAGMVPERARDVLPLSVKAELIMSANYNSWRNFFIKRTSPAAHTEMRRVVIPLLNEVNKRVPIIFEDIKP